MVGLVGVIDDSNWCSYIVSHSFSTSGVQITDFAMTRKLSTGGGGAVTVAALHQSTDGISGSGVKDTLLSVVEEGCVLPHLAMTKAAKRGSSDSKLMRVSSDADVHTSSRNRSSVQLQFSGRWSVEDEGLNPGPHRRSSGSWSDNCFSDSNGAVGGGTPRSCSNLSTLYNSSSNKRSSTISRTGNIAPLADMRIAEEGFTSLVRRRTFTSGDEKHLPSYDDHSRKNTNNKDDNVGGTVPMSVGEDIMPSPLFDKHNDAARLSRGGSRIGAKSWNEIAGTAVFTTGAMGDTASAGAAASSLARRNIFVMR